jgi:hypothetical protein
VHAYAFSADMSFLAYGLFLGLLQFSQYIRRGEKVNRFAEYFSSTETVFPDRMYMLSENSLKCMNIQYYGDYCFKISTKPAGRATDDIIIWTDPLEKGAGLRSPQGEANIVFLTHGDTQAARESLKGEPVIIDAPGEYAARGITALGFPAFCDEEEGALRGQNTVFVFESEDIHMCFLGALGHDLSPETLGKLNGIDILFVPVGGDDTISAKLAAELVRKIEPNVVIPMHYALSGLAVRLSSEKAFCEALGNCPRETLQKFNIKKKDLEEKMLEVVLLERGA